MSPPTDLPAESSWSFGQGSEIIDSGRMRRTYAEIEVITPIGVAVSDETLMGLLRKELGAPKKAEVNY